MTEMVNIMTNTSSQADTPTEKKGLPSYTPSILWGLAALLLILSIPFPYWHMTLIAPQYPDGLSLRIYVNRMDGDDDPVMDEVAEIDGLNHYIGMKSMYGAAKLERSIALPSVAVFVVLLGVAAFWRKKWAWLLTIPPMGFPFVYLLDLGLWLRYYGQNLDPNAPLSSAIKPFITPVLGVGTVGQFKTITMVGTGWFLALGATLCIIAAVVIHFKQLGQNNETQAATA